jgi:NADH:ubiquinone oxidoreductase subunit D
MNLSWDDYLTPTPEYEPQSPLVRTCSRELECCLTWIDPLLAETAPFSHPTENFDLDAVRELEDRGIEISNFDPETIAVDAACEAARFGDVSAVDLTAVQSGKAIVKFFDLRAAHRMRNAIIRIGALTWQLQFAHPEKMADSKNPPNNGTLILFHIPKTVTDDRISEEFQNFGTIREVRTSAANHFVEFWDLRDCAKAYHAAKNGKVCGVRVAAEYSRPGGFRKNPDAFLTERRPVIVRAAKKSTPIIMTTRSGNSTRESRDWMVNVRAA